MNKTRLNQFFLRLRKVVPITILGLFGITETAFANSCDMDQRRLFIWDNAALADARQAVTQNSDYVQPAYQSLMTSADKVIDDGPWSVTEKTSMPASGDKADYYSIGPYWWPDPKKDDGLPYIRRDGETNPERNTDAFDSVAMTRMSSAVETLTLAGYFSGDTKYSDRAALVLKHWFIDPATAMNPNLNFAQSIPGKVNGRGIGIIDTYRLVKVVDSIGLLDAQGYLSEDDMIVLRQWFADYARWMLRSDNGKKERLALNNHGVYYDAQLAIFAAFSSDVNAISKVIDGVESRRIPGQIDKKGKMPRELKRTRPFHYTAFTIKAFIDLAAMGECVDRDLWSFETKKGASLEKAISFQAGYANQLTVWPYKEIRKIKPEGLFENLCRSRVRSGWENGSLEAAYQHLAPSYETSRTNLLTNKCAPLAN